MNTQVRKPAVERGFTLAELLVVIAIISVLVGLLLPAVQSAREAANARTNHASLSSIAAAMETYRSLNGHYPDSITLLGQSGLNQELVSGVSGGYLYSLLSVTKTDFLAQGIPGAPGQTGNETCTFNHEKVLRCNATPDSDRMAGVMWMRTAALSAVTLSDFVFQFASAVTPHQIREHLRLTSTVPAVFNQMDVNQDGEVSFSDILQSSPGAPDMDNEYGAFLAGIQREMALGAANEHIGNLPGIRLYDLPSQQLCDPNDRIPCNIFPEPPQK